MQFTLIGRPTLVFNTTWKGSYYGISCVRGVSTDGKLTTFARAADVNFV